MNAIKGSTIFMKRFVQLFFETCKETNLLFLTNEITILPEDMINTIIQKFCKYWSNNNQAMADEIKKEINLVT
jgi:hypothetical protein